MSLISEALKKARLEAQKQDGRLPYHTRPALPRRRSSPWPWIAAVSAALAVGVVVGAILLGRREAPAPAQTPPAAAAEASRPSGSDPVTPAGPTHTNEASASEPQRRTPPEAAAPAETIRSPAQPPAVVAEETVPPEAASAGAAPSEPVADASPTPAPVAKRPTESPVPAAGPADGGSYLHHVTLGDGREIALRGIAWHASEPSALLNDRVLAVGDGVDDWTLVGIEPGRVEIAWKGVRFFVRLK